jgi:hypothetical protein
VSDEDGNLRLLEWQDASHFEGYTLIEYRWTEDE